MSRRSSTLTALSALLAGASALLAAPAAYACGGFFCNQTPVNQTGEHILFAQDGDTVEAHVLIQYQGDAESFSWVVPTPSLPVIEMSSAQIFSRLTQNTGIRFQLNWDYTNGCYPAMAEADDGATAGGGPPNADPGVTVINQSSVGPYDTATIQATAVEPMLEWLNANGYVIPDETGALLDPYVQMGDSMYFVAFKLQKDKSVGDLRPVLLRYQDDQPMVPIQLTAIASAPDLGVTVNILGPSRAVPENYLHVLLNEARIDWLNYGSN